MKFRYSKQHLAWLETWYKHWTLSKLTDRFNQKFGTSNGTGQIRAALHNHGFLCGRSCGNTTGSYRIFTEKQAAFIRRYITTHSNAQMACRLNQKFVTSFTASQIASFIDNRGIKTGRTGYFPKGHRPWCADTKGVVKQNCGNFKKGHVPANIRPVGSERIDSKDGYVLVKIRERDPYTGVATRYKQKHVVLWEKRNGPVPPGKVVIFRDGDKYNFRPGNIVCISRAELARLNQMHYREQPAILKPSVFALAILKTRVGELKNKKRKSA